MNLLRLEELESRDLLSSGYVAPQHFAAPSFALGGATGAAVLAERPAHSDFGQGSTFYGWNVMPAGPSWIIPLSSAEPAETTVVEWMVIIVKTPARQSSVTVAGTDPTSVPEVAETPKPPNADTGTAIAAVDSVTSPTATNSAARATSQTPFVIVPTVNAPTLYADLQGPISTQLANRSVRPADGSLGRTGSVNPLLLDTQSQTTPAASSGDASGESVAEPPAEPTPTLPGMLAALPAVDLAALGRGLEQFMDRIERVGEQIVGDGEGLRPWLIAAAAATAACEIARRQIQRTEDDRPTAVGAFGTATDL